MTDPVLKSSRSRDARSIDHWLDELRTRQRACNCVAFTTQGALWGTVAAVALAIALPLIDPAATRWLSMLTIPAGVLIGLVAGSLWPMDNLRLARALDSAAHSDDRFASAMQLASHPKAGRVQLVVGDALERVAGACPATALPIRTPRELKWIPAAAAALTLALWLMPIAKPTAQAQEEPSISAEEWQHIHQALADELREFPRETPEDRELVERLEKLAEKLKDSPDKKDALAEIAQLREELEKRAKAEGNDAASLRQAARAMQTSTALGQFAQLLQQGDYEAAAAELAKLAEQLEQDKEALTAEEYEAMAADFEQLGEQIPQDAEMAQACQNAAGAASRMNRDELAKACRGMSNTLKKNATKMRRGDGQCRARSTLDRLAKKLSQCKGGACKKCGDGQCNGNCNGGGFMPSQKKGGLKAGWGSAAKWDGGKIEETDEERAQDEEDPLESNGDMAVLPTISNDERAKSAQDYREVFANMVRKAEADLDLEQVPPAYREYLRRYFVSIKPAEREAEKEAKP